MKEKMRWKRVLALMLCVGLLPGCGAAEQEADTEEQYVVEIYEEPGTEVLALNEPETEAQPIQAEPPTEETVSDMLGSFLNWSALCSDLMGNTPKFREQDGLTPKQMIPMAAYTACAKDVRVTTDDSVGCYVITEDILKEYEEELFGRTCETSEYILDEEEQNAVDDRGINMWDCLGISSDGSAYVAMGDWGDAWPTFQVQEIVRVGDTNQFLVTANYYKHYMYDYVEHTITVPGDDPEKTMVMYDAIPLEGDGKNELGLVAEYTFEPSEDSSYGYIITDMKYMEPESDSSEK